MRRLVRGLAASGLSALVLGALCLPVSCGARGADFDIHCLDGMSYLSGKGLPYPTGFDSTDHATQSLDGPWRMRFESPGTPDPESLAVWSQGAWKDEVMPIRVPSTYNAPNGSYRDHQGPVWFALRFSSVPIPAEFNSAARPGHRMRLEFDGVLLRCRVWLNGAFLGERERGYTPFYFDLGGRLRPGGDNLLVVRADNRLTYGSLPPRVRPRPPPSQSPG